MTQSDTLVRLSSGVSGLDTVLGGGFFRGGIYLFQGTPGTGKTTLANQLCFHRIRSGERALFVTLLSEYHSRMTQYIGQLSFFDESKLPDEMSYISGIKTLLTDGLPGLLAMLRREIMTRKASILVIDGLIAAQRCSKSDQEFNEFIHDLQGAALATDCTVILLINADARGGTAPEHTVVDGILELGDQSFGWNTERALQVTKIRGTNYLRGKHAYRITDDGVLVFPRTEAVLAVPSLLDNPQANRVTSGNQRFDLMLKGGLPSSSPTLLAGPSGIGKTTFGLHFLAASNEAEPGLMFGFYETPARIRAKAEQVCRALIPLLDAGVVDILWQMPARDSLDAHADRILRAVRERGVRRLFLDGLGGLNAASTADRRIAQFLPALTNELRVRGVTTIYSLEAGNIIGPEAPLAVSEVSEVAENLVFLRYVESGAALHRIISILKVRDSDFDARLHEFALTDAGAVIEESSASAQAIMLDRAERSSGSTHPDLRAD